MANANALNTDELMGLIDAAPETVLNQLEEGSFPALPPSLPDHLRCLLERQHVSVTALIERSQLSKPFVYQILNGTRKPCQDALVRIALALRLDVEDTQRLLKVGRNAALYPKVSRDAALLSCIKKGMDLCDTSDFLEELGENPLV